MLDEWTPLRLMQEVSDVLKPLTVGAGPETLELQPSFSQHLTSSAQPQPNQYNSLLATPNTGGIRQRALCPRSFKVIRSQLFTCFLLIWST